MLWPATNAWPPEIDFNETDGALSSTTSSDHIGDTNIVVQRSITIDMTQWHTWGGDLDPELDHLHRRRAPVGSRHSPARRSEDPKDARPRTARHVLRIPPVPHRPGIDAGGLGGRIRSQPSQQFLGLELRHDNVAAHALGQFEHSPSHRGAGDGSRCPVRRHYGKDPLIRIRSSRPRSTWLAWASDEKCPALERKRIPDPFRTLEQWSTASRRGSFGHRGSN